MALRAWIGALLGFLCPVVAQNLLTNGDFETGTATGFTTSLVLDNSGTIANLRYTIQTNANLANAAWGPAADHTPGSGKFMYITRGASTATTTTAVWSATATAANGSFYTFRGFSAYVLGSGSAAQKPTYRLVVSDAASGGTFSKTFNFSTPATTFGSFLGNFTYTGSKSSLTYTLSIITGSSGAGQANAIAWDDFTLTSPEASTWAAAGFLSLVLGERCWRRWRSRLRLAAEADVRRRTCGTQA